MENDAEDMNEEVTVEESSEAGSEPVEEVAQEVAQEVTPKEVAQAAVAVAQEEDAEEVFEEAVGGEMQEGEDGEMDEEEGIVADETGGWNSSTLLKVTQARICDMKSLDERKNQIKPEDDPWWNIRNPKIYEKKSSKYTDVQSRLNKSTAAWENSRRTKAPESAPMTFKTSPPKNPDRGEHHQHTKKISSDSPLLKPTKESLQAKWHGKSERLSIERPDKAFVQSPKLLSKIKGSYPKEVQSRLMVETKTITHSKWKSKEDMKKEDDAVEAARKSASPKNTSVKVAGPSPMLTKQNAAMKAAQKQKKVYDEGDVRESGWKKFNISQNGIPAIDMGIPYRNSLDSVRSRDDEDSSSSFSPPPKKEEKEEESLGGSVGSGGNGSTVKEENVAVPAVPVPEKEKEVEKNEEPENPAESEDPAEEAEPVE